MIKISPAKFKRTLKVLLQNLPLYFHFCRSIRYLLHAFPRFSWIARLPIPVGLVVELYQNSNLIYLTNGVRCSIAKKIFWYRGIVYPIQDNIALSLFYSLSLSSTVIFDIGSNSGIFSLLAAKANPNSKIIAYDILPEAVHILTDNAIVNGLLSNIDISLVGVGIPNTFFQAPFFNVSSEMPSSLSLNTDVNSRLKVEVPVHSLDELCKPFFNHSVKLLIKIDVEGFEADIFRFGLKSLHELSPAIICEILLICQDLSFVDNILTANFYNKYLITDIGLVYFSIVFPHPVFKDWFFTKDKLDSIFNGFSVFYYY